MNKSPRWNDSLVMSYLGLRKAVGFIGFALPPVLVLGKWLLQDPGVQGSISAYYYTIMRDVLVGSLCAIAMFMLSYRGYERKDDIASNIASLSALGVALFPTKPAGDVSRMVAFVGYLHYASAIAFFLTMAYFSLVLFRKTDRMHPTREKILRNRVYTICGYTILVCIALVLVLSFVNDEVPVKRISPCSGWKRSPSLHSVSRG